MRIAVISDLHLGRGDRADRNFGYDIELLNLLDHLEMHHEMIVLLGDIWETLNAQWPWSHGKESNLVQAAHPKIAERFMGPKYRWIVGNHDRVMGSLDHVSYEWVVENNQLKIIFTHGHQFDLWSQELRYVSEGIVWLCGWTARMGTFAVTRFFDWFHTRITDTTERGQLGALEKRLIEQSQTRGAHITVMGHTHVPGITHVNEHILINSGHCLYGQFHFVSIDTTQGHCGVYRAEQNVTKDHDGSSWEMTAIATTDLLER